MLVVYIIIKSSTDKRSVTELPCPSMNAPPTLNLPKPCSLFKALISTSKARINRYRDEGQTPLS